MAEATGGNVVTNELLTKALDQEAARIVKAPSRLDDQMYAVEFTLADGPHLQFMMSYRDRGKASLELARMVRDHNVKVPDNLMRVTLLKSIPYESAVEYLDNFNARVRAESPQTLNAAELFPDDPNKIMHTSAEALNIPSNNPALNPFLNPNG